MSYFTPPQCYGICQSHQFMGEIERLRGQLNREVIEHRAQYKEANRTIDDLQRTLDLLSKGKGNG